MKIGVPSEVLNNEYRVSVTPAGVRELLASGHEVIVQSGAGVGSGFSDESYTRQGGVVVPTAEEVWAGAEMVVKVKEPVESELGFLREDLVLFSYLHLAAHRPLTDALIESGATAIAYETVQTGTGSLPLLMPMSEIAGRLSIVVGAYHLMAENGGNGKLLGGIAGVPRADVLVLGGGAAGTAATANAVGMGAHVTVIDVSTARLRDLESRFGPAVTTRVSTDLEVADQVEAADLVIGAVLVPGARAPKVVTDEMVRGMRPGAVLVDLAIDQGGCFEGSRPTTLDEPTYRVHESLFYCVTNLAGAVPQTATRALTGATLPYVQTLADWGWRLAMQQDPALSAGLNVWNGQVTNSAVAQAYDLDAVSTSMALIGSW